ncbi:chemotaxis-specific methylesterase [Salinarchaeum sp. Harcht-Bsk1]|uniref:chemotaxis-specific protein-glutamate methyltransferase CheB n=1 Tax=Salinarchaeum sp. Harcht-Bsk1 TaxID=1333523 RepID=UPI00034239DB|nr:chemotaxis-specific protein-glutamate methyltransferase CheB [Salinarchaeum sp. Harcht-Bsk1]AGN00005.1 chemotaxis-specific methylesterase [Salinarchaeum sp. Harcht-Bsk1]
MSEVLVVDDSQFMRTVLSTVLGEHGYDVVTASDGETAIDAVAEHEPDVITMDVEMPGMGGIEAVEHIMADHPTPIVMLSAYTKEGADSTLDALSRGAIDFLPKPSGEISADIGEVEDELIETIDAVEDADVDSVATSRAAAAARTAADAEAAVLEASATVEQALSSGESSSTTFGAQAGTATSEPSIETSEDSLVPDGFTGSPTIVIGASTGGPRVIERLLSELPVALNARVLIVQHMPASFTDRLSRRLDGFSEYDVREAADGARVAAGEALIARGDYHMEVAYSGPEHCKVRLTESERLHGVRPAIDVTMLSAAREVDEQLVGVALSGMGRDGAQGISTIKGVGGATIAQDEETSPVYGIPKQAISTGDVDRVLPDDEIVEGIVELAIERDDSDPPEVDLHG